MGRGSYSAGTLIELCSIQVTRTEIVNYSMCFLLTFDQIIKHYFQMDYFLKDTQENFVSAVVVRHRKREVGLLVPAKFTAVTKELTVVTVLSKICSFTRNFRFIKVFLLV